MTEACFTGLFVYAKSDYRIHLSRYNMPREVFGSSYRFYLRVGLFLAIKTGFFVCFSVRRASAGLETADARKYPDEFMDAFLSVRKFI